MSTKTFCDVCDHQIGGSGADRIAVTEFTTKVRIGRPMRDVHFTIKAGTVSDHDGHLCNWCLYEAIMRTDPRPQSVEA